MLCCLCEGQEWRNGKKVRSLMYADDVAVMAITSNDVWNPRKVMGNVGVEGWGGSWERTIEGNKKTINIGCRVFARQEIIGAARFLFLN